MKDKDLNKKFRKTWENILYRCTNPKDKRYEYYKNKGVCNEWLEYNNFRKDMLLSFVFHVNENGLKNTTIDRIDNNKGYCKENCRWATWEEQRINKKSYKKAIEINCPQCHRNFLTTNYKKKFCNIICTKLFIEVPMERQKERKKAYQRFRFNNDIKWKSSRKASSKKWLDKVKSTVDFRKKRSEYMKMYRAKKWKCSEAEALRRIVDAAR